VSLINSLRSSVGWISRRNVTARELIKSAKARGPHDGLLAAGTFTPTGVVCPAASVGQATDMPLLDAMREGLTYINVHTNDGVGLTSAGPGNFPRGEIRGQLD